MLKSISLKVEMVLSILLAAIIPMVLFAYISLSKSEKALEDDSFSKLEALTKLKKTAIENYFKDIRTDIEFLSQLSVVRDAIKKLDKYNTDAKPKGYTGNRMMEYSPYRKAHDRYHGIFKTYIEKFGYHDLFLMCPDEGDIFYTVAKEQDFGTIATEFTSSLANAWKTAMQGESIIADFEPYEPSGGVHAAFIAFPVKENGEIIGVIALQISDNEINTIMQERTGLGKTGETYLVGKDKDSGLSFRSNMVLAGNGKHVIGYTLPKTPKHWEEAFSGTSEKTGVYSDCMGTEALINYTKLGIQGVEWAVFSKLDMAEVDIPITELKTYMLWIGAIIGILAIIAGLMVALIINKEIKEVGTQIKYLVKKILEGNLESRGEPQDTGVDFREIVGSINNLISAFVTPISMTSNCLSGIASGDIPQKITEDYQGDFNKIKDNINRCIDMINTLSDESLSFVDRIQEGCLSTQADVTMLNGRWAEIVAALNMMTNSFVMYFDLVPSPLMMVDREMKIQFINKTGYKLADSSRDDLGGRFCFDIFQTSDCNTQNCAVAKAINSGDIVTRETDAHPCGKDLEIYYSGAPIKDRSGNIIGGLEIIVDQTNQKNANRKLSEMVLSIKESISELSAGSSELTNVAEQLLDASNQTFEQSHSVAASTEELSTTIASIASASEEVNTNASNVSDNSQRMAENTETAAAAVEEMTTAIKNVSDNAEQSAQVAKDANEKTNAATTMMDSLGKAAGQIGKVTDLIKKIAEQTNMLALNATIEAASAGEAGKGFAVVANEIKELAKQSAKAAENIAEEIEGVQSSTDSAVNMIKEVSDIIDLVSENITGIDLNVREQSLTASEVSKTVAMNADGIRSVSRAIVEITTGIADVSRSTGEGSNAAQSISEDIAKVSSIADSGRSSAEKVKMSAHKLVTITKKLENITEGLSV